MAPLDFFGGFDMVLSSTENFSEWSKKRENERKENTMPATKRRIVIRPTSDATMDSRGSMFAPFRGPITNEVRIEGYFEFEVEDLDSYVKVQYIGGRHNAPGGSYTYRDPSGELRVGDLVEVPVGRSGVTFFAKVIGEGRGAYQGPVKDVIGKLSVVPFDA